MRNENARCRTAEEGKIRRLGKPLLRTLSLVLFSNLICHAQSRPLLTHHVREVTLNGQARLVGHLPAEQSMRLVIALPLRNQIALDSFLKELYRPLSPSYHQFLTVEEFTSMFGPTADDYDAVIRFAKANGLTVSGTSRNRVNVDVTGPVASIEKAFHLAMGVYQHPTENRTFYAPDREPTVELPFQLWHISGLDNYSIPQPALVRRMPGVHSLATTGSCPQQSFCGSDMRAAYYEGTSLTGSGQSLGLLEYYGTDLSDLDTYYQNAGQTNNVPITLDSTDGTSTSCFFSDGCVDIEQTLDMTQALGMAPGLSSLVVYIGSTDAPIFNAMATADPLNAQLSSSWTWYPADPNTDNPYFQEFAAQGQNLFQAAGDFAAWSPYSEIYPADDIYLTSVGGTDLETSGAAGPWSSETAWSDGGGGISPDLFAIPSWQTATASGCSYCSTVYRNGPDVSANANYSFYVCADQTTCTANYYGGTSFAAPMWAGYLALVNQQAAADGNPSLGFINPALYTIGLSSSYHTDFHDVTSGSNGYSATVGYDLATGWGSPNGSGLINTLAGSPCCTLTPIMVGQATVTSTDGDINCTNTGSGTTGTCSATFSSGTTVTLNATHAAGWAFAGWSGPCSGGNPCVVVMNQNLTPTAAFVEVCCTLAVSEVGQGSVTSTDGMINCSDGTGACSATYASGSVVTLNAAPATNWIFSGWSGACNGAGPCTLTMSSNQNVTATFTLPSYTLTVSDVGQGAVTSTDGMINCSNGAGACSATYTNGSMVTLNAAAATNWTFSGWSGACSGGAGSCVLTIGSNEAVVANFHPPFADSPTLTTDFFGDGKGDVGVWRPDTGTWYILSNDGGENLTQVWGLPGDVPVPGDYYGVGKDAFAVWRPSNGTWYILSNNGGPNTTVVFGLPKDVPVPADYDGDGKTDIAVWRPSNGTFYVILSSTGQTVTKQWGLPGDVPVTGDYDGDGKADYAVFRPSNGTWYIIHSSTGQTVTTPFGLPGDIPAEGDYENDGKTDVAVWRASTATFYVLQSSTGKTVSQQWGAVGDIPVVGDYNGDGVNDYAVFRPSNGTWYIDYSSGGGATTQWGLTGDIPASHLASIFRRDKHIANYDGDRKADIGIWRPSNATYYVIDSSTGKQVSGQWGENGDLIVPGDYDGDGKTDYANWRPSTQEWWVTLSGTGKTVTKTWGLSGDIPLPGDYDGDGKIDYAVWRPSNQTWYVIYSSTGQTVSQKWGASGDIPVPGDYDGDDRTDYAIWRPSTGTWWVLLSSTGKTVTEQWGLSTDIPVPGDYDGDTKTDFTIFRPSTGTWYTLQSSNGKTVTTVLGQDGDVPVAKDYDGDEKTDIAVFRPSNGTWYILQSSNGQATSTAWGLLTDVPVNKPTGQ
jgi:hypothetical protein